MSTTITAYHNKIHPKKLMLWIALASITMMFAAFTSALVVKKAGGNWLDFVLPTPFLISSILVIFSSILAFLGLKAAKSNDTKYLSAYLSGALVLGIAFIGSQFLGFKALTEGGVFLVDPSTVAGSFIYVISGVHVLHVLGGIVALAISVVKSYQKKINKDNTLGLELAVTYWHFVDILWVYLYLFFILN